MLYSDSEIIKSYNAAFDKEKQIRTLAELNGCSQTVIRNIVEGKADPDRHIKPYNGKRTSKDMVKVHEEIQKYYDAGWHDNYIAIMCHCSGDMVRRWRMKHNLPKHDTVVHGRVYADSVLPNEELSRQIKKWYDLGYHDSTIAQKVGVSGTTIKKWRISHRLPMHENNVSNAVKLREQYQLKLFKEGKTDDEIAEAVGLKKATIQQWRSKEGLYRDGLK